MKKYTNELGDVELQRLEDIPPPVGTASRTHR